MYKKYVWPVDFFSIFYFVFSFSFFLVYLQVYMGIYKRREGKF